MEFNLPNRPGVNTRAQSALGGGEDRIRPSSLANPPKKTTKIPRMELSKEARVDIPVPRQTEEPGNIDVRDGGDPAPSRDRPRQNPPHQLAPSVAIHNPPLQISDHASDSRRMSEQRRRRDTSKVKVLLTTTALITSQVTTTMPPEITGQD
ncbi:hypothetical protein LIER_03448 [Lithospermum erythrorhizon]|uniref:Uncharacterized protein n=1 Tax=Lithospermum erythrorhizon TaxID=34254 RepID=A0AAV3NT68_LITER